MFFYSRTKRTLRAKITLSAKMTPRAKVACAKKWSCKSDPLPFSLSTTNEITEMCYFLRLIKLRCYSF